MKQFFSSLVTFVESRKFWTAFVGFLLSMIPLYVHELPVWYNALVAFLTAIGVYVVPNASTEIE